MNRKTSFFLAAAIGLGGAAAHGSLLMHDDFAYPTGQTLHNQEGGVGWGADNPWFMRTGDSAAAFTITDGLSFSNLVVSGNAALFTPDGFTVINREIGAAPEVGGTLWASYLYQLTDFGTLQVTHGFRVNTGADAGGGSSTYRAYAVRSTEPHLGTISVTRNPEETAVGDGLVEDETYLILARWTDVGQETSTGDIWALTESDFDQLIASDWDETVLDSSHQYHGSVEADGVAPFTTDLFFQPSGERGQGIIDEVRFGTTLQSVTPIPEPAALSLLGLGGLMFLRRRRRTA